MKNLVTDFISILKKCPLHIVLKSICHLCKSNFGGGREGGWNHNFSKREKLINMSNIYLKYK